MQINGIGTTVVSKGYEEPSSELVITPPSIGGTMDTSIDSGEATDEDESLSTMTNDIARSVLSKLDKLLDNDDLNIQDLKDITSMSKDISAYLVKSQGTKPRSDRGLGMFLSRLKA